jgi:hypothetical protein
VPGRIFGPAKEKITGEWGKLHDKISNLIPSLYIIRMITSGKMAEYVAYVIKRSIRNPLL